MMAIEAHIGDFTQVVAVGCAISDTSCFVTVQISQGAVSHEKAELCRFSTWRRGPLEVANPTVAMRVVAIGACDPGSSEGADEMAPHAQIKTSRGQAGLKFVAAIIVRVDISKKSGRPVRQRVGIGRDDIWDTCLSVVASSAKINRVGLEKKWPGRVGMWWYPERVWRIGRTVGVLLAGVHGMALRTYESIVVMVDPGGCRNRRSQSRRQTGRPSRLALDR